MTFSMPVGDPDGKVWPPAGWARTNWYLAWYWLGAKQQYHTGDDLVYSPKRDAIGKLMYAMHDGEVTHVGIGGGTWGTILVMRHDLKPGVFYYARYGHLNKVYVKAGDKVRAGQPVAEVGESGMPGTPHVHIDVSKFNNSTLKTRPNDWPGTDKNRITANYQSPKPFILSQIEPASRDRVLINATPWLNIRKSPTVNSAVTGRILKNGFTVVLDRATDELGRTWRYLEDDRGWVAEWLLVKVV